MSQKACFIIWVILMVLVGVSISLGNIGDAKIAIIGIFAIATFKAYLVTAYYMHLKGEAKFISVALFSGLACLAILFFALIPDIVRVYGRITG